MPAQRRFDSKTALISGAGRGIGRAVALRLAREGATVVINDVDESRVRETISAIEGIGGRAVSGPADVTDEGAVAGVVSRARDVCGSIDVLVNNAGGPMPSSTWAPVADMSLREWNDFLALNLTSAFLLSRAVIPHMRERGSGRIVAVSSISGFHGQRGGAAYSAGKAGLHGLVASLAKELAPDGIGVNGVVIGNAPHPTRTAERQDELDRLVHLGRVGALEEFAAAVAFLCSDDASYLSGAMIDVDGGFGRSIHL